MWFIFNKSVFRKIFFLREKIDSTYFMSSTIQTYISHFWRENSNSTTRIQVRHFPDSLHNNTIKLTNKHDAFDYIVCILISLVRVVLLLLMSGYLYDAKRSKNWHIQRKHFDLHFSLFWIFFFASFVVTLKGNLGFKRKAYNPAFLTP